MPIQQLSPNVAAKIAAGEVVERPASVVKELIENSIDAGATQIRVDLTNGGLQLIRVTDNGCGIAVEELPLALARHATSKVSRIDDLEHIRTLGFRGEALASIAAVAEVTLVSRSKGTSQGAQVEALNGQLSQVSTAASPEGTSLTIRNLFSTVPARLKFLKSRNTEVSHCLHLLEQYALAYPEIRFQVFSEGRPIFATAGDGQLSQVLVEIYGLQIAEQMVSISSLDGKDDDPERPIASGYISRPTCYKSTRQYISFFVNRRWVLSRILTAAVEEAYHSLLLAGRHPIAVVNIQLDPTLIDVNVHPAKTEIRFLKERRVFAAILRAVRQALLEEPQMQRWSQGEKVTLSRSHSGFSPTIERVSTQENTLEEGIEEDIELPEVEGAVSGRDTSAYGLDQSVPTRDELARGSDTSVPTEEADFPQDNPWLTVTEEDTGSKPPLLSRLWQSHIRTSEDSPSTDQVSMRNQEPSPMVGQDKEVIAHELVTRTAKLPPLRVIGQLSQSYIVTEGPEGMYLIDQHAAHERILLERMVAALQASTSLSQLLLTPIQLTLSPGEVEAIETYQTQLEHIGFRLEFQGDNILAVTAVPNVLMKQLQARSLHELLADLTDADNQGHTETWEEHALANIACKAAIKANYFLTVSEMREMIEQLEQTRAPYSCCHGRPTMVHFSLSALDHEFGRR